MDPQYFTLRPNATDARRTSPQALVRHNVGEKAERPFDVRRRTGSKAKNSLLGIPWNILARILSGNSRESFREFQGISGNFRESIP